MSDAAGQPAEPAETQRPAERRPADVEQILRRLVEVIEQARPMPLSSSVMITKEEVLELLDYAVESLPREMQEARWLLKEREEFLDRARQEGREIVAQASTRAEQMVQRTEVVRAAEAKARRIVADAEAEARRMAHQVEDFCDQRLASFEIALEKVGRSIAEGRSRLRQSAAELDPLAPPIPQSRAAQAAATGAQPVVRPGPPAQDPG